MPVPPSKPSLEAELDFLQFPVKKAQITGVAAVADQSPQYRVFHGAAILMGVRAIGKAAQVHQRPKLWKKAFHFFGNDVPKLELPDPWRVDHPAAEFEPD